MNKCVYLDFSCFDLLLTTAEGLLTCTLTAYRDLGIPTEVTRKVTKPTDFLKILEPVL